ncbi:MAG: vWA domain-containing protein [Eubacteriaceae bacterium]
MLKRIKKKEREISLTNHGKGKSGKKILTLFLAVVLILGSFPFGGVAAAVGENGYEISKNPLENREHYETDGVAYRKSIAAVVGNDYAFDITLSVTTRQKIVPVNTGGASVVLVMDQSSSMDKQIPGGGGITYLEEAKKAAKDFGAIFLGTGNSSSNEIAMVSYAQTAVDTFPIDGLPTFATDIAVYNTGVDRYGMANLADGTNIQSGIELAKNLLGSAKPGNEKYILVMTDGLANYGNIGNEVINVTPPLSFIETVSGESFPMEMTQKYTSTDGRSAFPIPVAATMGTNLNELMAATISSGLNAQGVAKVYSVYFQNWAQTGVASDHAQSQFTMRGIATDRTYLLASGVGELAKEFEEIATDIIVKSNSWRITDPMPNNNYVVFDNNAAVKINGTEAYTGNNLPPGVTFEGNTLQWNMLDPRQTIPPVEVEVSPGVKEYQYSLTYRIKIDPDKNPPTTPFDTNGETTLDYYVTGDGKPAFNPDDPDTYEKVPFEVPQVVDKDTAPKEILVKAKNMVAYQGGSSLSGDVFPSPYYDLFVKGDDGNWDMANPLTEAEFKALSFTVDKHPLTADEKTYYLYDVPYRAYFKIGDEIFNYLPDEGSPVTYKDAGTYTIELTTKKVGENTYHEPGATSTTGSGRIDADKTYRLTTNNAAPGILEVRPYDGNTPTSFVQVLELGHFPSGPVTDPTASVYQGTRFFNSAGIEAGKMYGNIPEIDLMGDTIFFTENATKIGGYIDDHWGDLAINGRNFIPTYLDLVDHKNGNIIIEPRKADGITPEGVTVYYPYPPGTNKDTLGGFTVIQFPNMKRTPEDSTVGATILTGPTDVQLEEQGIKFRVNGMGAFAIGYLQQPLYFNIDKALTVNATEKEQFVFRIEKLEDPAAAMISTLDVHALDIVPLVGVAPPKVFYTVITVNQGGSLGSDKIKVSEPGQYQITELPSNWRYGLTEINPVGILPSTILTVDAGDTNPNSSSLKKATFTNNKDKTEGLGDKESVTNKMKPNLAQ